MMVVELVVCGAHGIGGEVSGPVPRSIPFRVIRDGFPLWKLRCPDCGLVADLDVDQFYGRVSIQCPSDGCSFHETWDFSRHVQERDDDDL